MEKIVKSIKPVVDGILATVAQKGNFSIKVASLVKKCQEVIPATLLDQTKETAEGLGVVFNMNSLIVSTLSKALRGSNVLMIADGDNVICASGNGLIDAKGIRTFADPSATRGRKPVAVAVAEVPVAAKRGRKPATAVVEEEVPATPVRRGRKPATAVVEEEVPATPVRRGRKPAAVAEVPVAAKRGRKPAATVVEEEVPTTPVRRGRKPAAVAEVPVAAKRGRKPATAVVEEEVPVPTRKGPLKAPASKVEVPTAKRGRKPAVAEVPIDKKPASAKAPVKKVAKPVADDDDFDLDSFTDED